jgi:hypothetical protein
MLKTPARWQKSVMHLSERGEIENSQKDIGKLIKEVKNDIEKECGDEIRDTLYSWAIDNILRGVIVGFPEWYKEKLLNSQFEQNENA